MSELLLHENVLDLATNIKANGFFPSEPLIAIWEDDKVVVVEGNRRLAACKLLLNPGLAPAQYKSRFVTLASTFAASSIKKVPVLIAPNRQATIPLVIARHTSPQIERWETAMRANFYHRLIREGMTIAEVAARFNVSAPEVKEALYSHNLYQMACRLDLSPDATAVVRNPRAFNLTTLVRVFEAQSGRVFFGVELGEDGVVRGKIPAEEFRKGFSRLVRDVALEKVDSRILNKPKDIENYLTAFEGEEKPDLTKSGRFDSTTFLIGGRPATKPTVRKTKTKRLGKGMSLGLIPKNFVCNTDNQRVQDLLLELRALRPEKFPNACALAVRCFVELNVYLFLKERKELPKIRATHQAKVASKGLKLPPGWSPELSVMLKWIQDNGLGLDAHVIKALPKLREEALYTLNLYSHNTAYHPSGADLRNIWKNSHEFVMAIVE